MSNISPPPNNDPVTDEDGLVSMMWMMFFNGMYQGDTGTDWTPNFQNLTSVGTPTITGRYYMISRQLAFFRVRIEPSTSVSATVGLTAIDNFPPQIISDGACLAVSGLTGGSAPGMINAADQKIYIPALSAVSVPVTIIGLVEVQ